MFIFQNLLIVSGVSLSLLLCVVSLSCAYLVCQGLNTFDLLPTANQSKGDCVQLHAPSQALPKANTAVVLDRTRKWSVFCSQGTAEPYGGQEVARHIEAVPLKLILNSPFDFSIQSLVNVRVVLSFTHTD